MDVLKAVSIDIGIKNFAIYTENINLKLLRMISKPPQGKRKLLLPSEDNLKTVYTSGTAEDKYTDVFNLAGNQTGDELTIEIRKTLFETLAKLKELWETTNLVIIEKQFINLHFSRDKKGGTANITMIRLAESCFTWILDHYPHLKIYYFPSHYKTVFCLCPKTFLIKQRKTGKFIERKATKHDRKKWSIKEGQEILLLRNDDELLSRLKAKRKQKLDDICDCILQLQAFKWDELVPCT